MNFKSQISNFRFHPRRRGFSFTEVMFAVILLGLGFIMVAAIFPVALRQSQATLEETAGVAVGKSGAVVMQGMGASLRQAAPSAYAYSVNCDPLTAPAVGTRLHRFTDPVTVIPPSAGGITYAVSPQSPAFDQLSGNLIQGSDPRYAWIPVAYQCSYDTVTGTPWNYAKVWLMAVQARNRSTYEPQDLQGYTFVPKAVTFCIEERDTEPDRLWFTPNPTTLTQAPFPPAWAAEGAYVLVADDQLTGSVTLPGMQTVYQGAANGRVYRLGTKRDDLGPSIWELISGSDMSMSRLAGADGVLSTSDDIEQNENLPPRLIGVAPGGGDKPARGFMIGRGYENPLGPPAVLRIEGAVQDLFVSSANVVRLP